MVSFVGGLLYVKSLPEPEPRGMVFLTVGLDQDELKNEDSSYEIQRAVEHFANVILGWTVEPSFAEEFDAAEFSGRRQEKQNLLFTVRTDEVREMKEFVHLIEKRLDEYNDASNSGYVLAVKRYSVVEPERAEFRMILGIVLVSLIFVGLILFAYDYAYRNRS